jgi:anti-anti-sigma factor
LTFVSSSAKATRVGSALDLEERSDGAVHTLVLAGELDMSSGPALQERLARARDGASIVLDLAGLAFIDSAGLRALLTAHADCSRRDCEIEIVGARPPVLRLFEIAGVLDTLSLVEREQS